MVSRDARSRCVRSVRSLVRSFSELYSAPRKAHGKAPMNRMCGTRERCGVNPYNPLHLIKLVINIHLWVKLYTFGRKYTHSGVNKSEMCSLDA